MGSFFLFFLGALIFLYAAIDFSMGGAHLSSQSPFFWKRFALHLLSMLAKHAGFLSSLSFLLAYLKTIFDLHAQRELLALQTGGVSTKVLLAPFFFFAAILSCASYAHLQWVMPQTSVDAKKEIPRVFSFDADDGSEIVYHSYHPEEQALHDVFWIYAPDDFWAIQKLCLNPPKALFAEHFVSSERAAVFESLHFADLPIQSGSISQQQVPLEQRSLLSLAETAYGSGSGRHKALAHLHYKLSLPCIPFLCLLALSPFALRFSRNSSRALLVACALFSYAGLAALLDAMLILAENRVLDAHLALWGPICLLLAPSLAFFLRIR